jgi:hypothetical protein
MATWGVSVSEDGTVTSTAADLETLGRFLARRDVATLDPHRSGPTYDVLVLCGSAVLASAELAARAVHDGVAGHLLVSGGIGHSTPYLAAAIHRHPTYADVVTEGRSEAAILADVLVHHLDVPQEAVTTEEESRHCGENAELSLRVMAGRGGRPSVLLVQDPTMQRRTHASFDHHQRGDARPLVVVSHAPFVPVVGTDGVGDGQGGIVWTLDRFTSLALGEVCRLRDDAEGYGPRGAGFIGHVDVPDPVQAAYLRLRTAGRPRPAG